MAERRSGSAIDEHCSPWMPAGAQVSLQRCDSCSCVGCELIRSISNDRQPSPDSRSDVELPKLFEQRLVDFPLNIVLHAQVSVEARIEPSEGIDVAVVIDDSMATPRFGMSMVLPGAGKVSRPRPARTSGLLQLPIVRLELVQGFRHDGRLAAPSRRHE